jgi:hypothetical protein
MQTIQDALRQATFYSDNEHYYLVKLHPKALWRARASLPKLVNHLAC